MVRDGSDGRYVPMGIWAVVPRALTRWASRIHRRPRREVRGAVRWPAPELATLVGNAEFGRERPCAATPAREGEWSASERAVG
jgi:hypothetical protein